MTSRLLRDISRKISFATGLLRPSNLSKAGKIYSKYGPQEFVRRFKAKLQYRYTDQRYRYQDFLRQSQPTALELDQQRQAKFNYRPCFGVVIPLYNTKLEYLQDLLEGFKAQTYTNFKLFMVDASLVEQGKTVLTDTINAAAAEDPRIIYKILGQNLGIAGNTNQAIALAMNDSDVTHIGLCDHDDFIEPDTLYQYTKVLNENQNVKIIYSDEDVVKAKNDPEAYYVMKPDFSPYLMESCNYINHFFVCEKQLLESIKTKDGLYEQPKYDGAQDYDLYLRLIEAAFKLDEKLKPQETVAIKDALYTSTTIHHIPRVLYHWRAAETSTAEDPHNKMYAFDAGKHALEDYYRRRKVDNATVEHTDILGTYRTKYQLEKQPLVSVIISNSGRSANLRKAIASVKNGTYQNLEVIIAGQNSIQQAKGSILLFLNNVEMIDPDSITEMVAILKRQQVGVVGAKLLFQNGELEHAGMIVGPHGNSGHIFYHIRPEFTYGNRANCVTNYSAVTSACLMVKKSTYEKVGGFDDSFTAAFKDVDFCLKIRALGDLIVYTPHAQFYYLEDKNHSTDRPNQKLQVAEANRLSAKWPQIYQKGDPYYNPNFSLQRYDCSLKEDSVL